MLNAEQLRFYFDRIGFAGEARADRRTLAEIARLHAAAIPFENIDPLLGRVPDLTPDALVDKMVHRRRGGMCFEQDGLLWHVLEAIGFEVTALAGRVRWNIPDPVPMPRTHMALLVRVDGQELIVDAGFGGAVLAGVLELREGEQATPHEPFRFLRNGELWVQQIRIGEDWRTTYTFDLVPQQRVDFEVANWWVSTSPKSPFTHSLMAAIALPDRRLGLRNGDLSVHHTDGRTERRQIGSVDELVTLLGAGFGIDIPDEGALRARVEELGLLRA